VRVSKVPIRTACLTLCGLGFSSHTFPFLTYSCGVASEEGYVSHERKWGYNVPCIPCNSLIACIYAYMRTHAPKKNNTHMQKI
jgi:hypothetical protein